MVACTEALERRTLIAEGLRDVLVVLNSNRPLDEVLNHVVARARALVGAQACVLYRLDQNQDRVLVEASDGLPPFFTRVDQLPLNEKQRLGDSILDATILSEAPFIDAVIDEETGAGEAALSPAVTRWQRAIASTYRAVLSVPLMVNDTYAGSLAFYFTGKHSATGGEISLVRSFSSQVALVIENANLRTQAEQTAVLQERERLARDLHDSVTQSLYSLTLLAEAARRLANAGDLDQVQTAIARLGAIGQQALKEMRLLVYELRPSVLQREGLVRALRHRLETVERRAGVEVQMLTENYQTQPASLEAELYHVIQEALNNVLKHAAASEVVVSLTQTGQHLHVNIEDNGQGFDVETLAESSGFGLASMQERVEKFGGNLTLTSRPGHGTQVTITLILEDDSHGTQRDGITNV